MADRESLLVARLLSQRLPRHILSFAKPLPEMDPNDPVELEPWIRLAQPGRIVEVHIREGGDVELHVYVPGRERDPRESLFVCDDGDFMAFADRLVENFDSVVDRLS